LDFQLVHDFPLLNSIKIYSIQKKNLYLHIVISGTSSEVDGYTLGRGRVNTSAIFDFVPTAY
jgi:hypothetical protein